MRRPLHRNPLDANRMTNVTAKSASHFTVGSVIAHALSWLDRVPYAVLTLPLRLAVATVFWNSAMAKLANWDTTISLFADEYSLPLLPPVLAANMALAIELTTPVLLLLGLFTRVAALVLLGMTVRDRNLRVSAGVADPYPMGSDVARPALPGRRQDFIGQPTVAPLPEP